MNGTVLYSVLAHLEKPAARKISHESRNDGGDGVGVGVGRRDEALFCLREKTRSDRGVTLILSSLVAATDPFFSSFGCTVRDGAYIFVTVPLCETRKHRFVGVLRVKTR